MNNILLLFSYHNNVMFMTIKYNNSCHSFTLFYTTMFSNNNIDRHKKNGRTNLRKIK